MRKHLQHLRKVEGGASDLLTLLKPTMDERDVAAALLGTPACISMFGA